MMSAAEKSAQKTFHVKLRGEHQQGCVHVWRFYVGSLYVSLCNAGFFKYFLVFLHNFDSLGMVCVGTDLFSFYPFKNKTKLFMGTAIHSNEAHMKKCIRGRIFRDESRRLSCSCFLIPPLVPGVHQTS